MIGVLPPVGSADVDHSSTLHMDGLVRAAVASSALRVELLRLTEEGGCCCWSVRSELVDLGVAVAGYVFVCCLKSYADVVLGEWAYSDVEYAPPTSLRDGSTRSFSTWSIYHC